MIAMVGAIVGVVIGAVIALLGTNLNNKFMLRSLANREERYEKMKEIDTLVLLRKKIDEILYKRVEELNTHSNVAEFTSFDNFDDCSITIDDYIYLQSFCAQNHYYLPTYMVETFFKTISHRRVVLNPDEVRRVGAYTYTGGRLILEEFADEINDVIQDRKIELKQLTKAR